MNPAPGEIYWVAFPSSEGREQAGQRPALVIQEASLNLSLPTTLVVPITSNLKASVFPGTIIIDPTEQNGLSVRSVLLVFQLRAIDKRRFLNRAGAISVKELAEVFTSVDLLMGKKS